VQRNNKIGDERYKLQVALLVEDPKTRKKVSNSHKKGKQNKHNDLLWENIEIYEHIC